MPQFKVVLIEHGYATTEHERRIIEAAGGTFIDAEKLSTAEALALCEDADGVLCRRLELTRELIGRLRRCRIIVRYGVGTDNVDVAAATEAGIVVGHVPHYCPDEVATHAIALWLACARRVVSTHERMRGGAWDVHRDEPIRRLAGRTLGIIGLGNIGRTVARRLGGWALKLLANDPFVEPSHAAELGVELVSLDELLGRSDYVTIHCPLLPETHHLLSAGQFARMKPGAILVNTARGPIVDGRALATALDRGRPELAGLDVFEDEPLPADSPLRSHPRLVLTDHAAWYSEESQVELQTTAAEEVVRVCTGGLPRSLANPEVIDRLGRRHEWQPPEHLRWQLKRLAWLRSQSQPPEPANPIDA